MADLSSMFQNLGPTGGALMSGLTTGQDLVSSMNQDKMRQAQMDEILQRTSAQKDLIPLELEAKKQTVASGQLKAKQEQDAYRDDVLSKAIPRLQTLKGPQRAAEYEKIFTEAGLPLDEKDRQYLYSQDPDKFLSDLKTKHEWTITQRPAYRQAVDVANVQKQSHLAGINAQGQTQKDLEQIRIDAGKYNKNKLGTDVGTMLLKAKDSRQKAEILESAYYTALDNGDNETAATYLARAKEARARAAEDAANRAIGAPGSMYDPTQSVIVNKPSAAAKAPIGGPALGTAANPIVLK